MKTNNNRMMIVCAVGVSLLLAQNAFGYIGPGGGLTAIGAVLALLVALVVAVLGFLWYPIKRMRRAMRQRKSMNASAAPAVEQEKIS